MRPRRSEPNLWLPIASMMQCRIYGRSVIDELRIQAPLSRERKPSTPATPGRSALRGMSAPEAYPFAPEERPLFPGSPYSPQHTRAHRIGYEAIAVLDGVLRPRLWATPWSR